MAIQALVEVDQGLLERVCGLNGAESLPLVSAAGSLVPGAVAHHGCSFSEVKRSSPQKEATSKERMSKK